MVARRRIGGGEALSFLERGKTSAAKKLLRRVVTTPWAGVRVVLAFARPADYYAAVNKAKTAMLAEIPLLAKESGSIGDHAAAMAQVDEAAARLADTVAVDRAANVKVLCGNIFTVYDPAISTADDPAVTLGFLVNIGVPLSLEDYDASRAADEVVVTPSLIAVLLAASDSLLNLCVNQSFNLSAFYEKKLEPELKNSEPSPDTVLPEGSSAANAVAGGSTSLQPQPSGDSTNTAEGKSSIDGPANS